MGTTTILNIQVQGGNQIATLTNQLNAATNANNSLNQSMSQTSSAAGQYNVAINNISKNTISAAGAADRLSLSWGSIERIMIGSAISRTIGMIIRGFQGGVTSAAEFLLRIGEIQTLSQQNQQSTAAWTAQVRGLSDAFGVSALKVAEAQYQAISNQIAHGAESTTFLNEALRLSVITVASADNAVQALTGVLNSYHLSADSARMVSDKLFKTVELGRLRLDQIGLSIGTVTAVASQLGVAMDDVFASLVVLTRLGIQPAVAMTELRGIMMKLIKPTDEMKKLFREWGVETGEVAVKTYGFVGIFEKLLDAANKGKGIINEMGETFNNIRAIVGATGIAANLDLVKDSLLQIGNGAKTADEAMKIMQQNTGYQMRVEWERIKNIFTIGFGTEFIDSMAAINANLGGFSKIIKVAVDDAIFFGKALAVWVIGSRVLIPLAESVILLGQFARILKVTSAEVAANTALTEINTAAKVQNANAQRAAATATLGVNPNVVLMALVGGYLAADAVIKQFNRTIKEGIDDRVSAERQAAEAISSIETQVAASRVQANVNAAQSSTQAWLQAIAQQKANLYELELLQQRQINLRDKIFELDVKRVSPLTREKMIYKEMVELVTNLQQAIAKGVDDKEITKLISQMEKAYGRAGDLKNKLMTINDYANTAPGNTVLQYTVDGMYRLDNVYNRFIDTLKNYDARLNKDIDLTNQNLSTQKNLVPLLEAKAQKLADLTTKYQEYSQAAAKTDALERETLGTMSAMSTKLSELFGGFAAIKRIQIFGSAEDATAWDKEYHALKKLTEQFNILKQAGTNATDAQRKELDKAVQEFDKVNKAFEKAGGDWPSQDWQQQIEKLRAELNLYRGTRIESTKIHEAVRETAESMNFLNSYTEENRNLLQQLQIPLQTMKDAPLITANNMRTLLSTMDPMASIVGNTVIKWQEMVSAINTATDAVTRFKQTQAAQPQSQWVGGYIAKRFAGGGIASDTIPAYLAADEVVMNRMASRQFMPQLIAMNAGTRNYNNGGNVTTNVGDINVSVEGGNSSERTVREIGEKLRREIRRGTIRL